jgi:DNA invertase Pin-like site-specific DNA recombinase
MNIGYARVSTTDQNLDLQTDALAKAGCEKIFTDVASGAKADRVGLAESMGFARTGDTLVVWKLDRLGRSLPHLIATVRELESKGIGFRSVQEAIDTTSPAGKLFFHMIGALAEFERDIIRERTKAGLFSARARGRLGGRPKALDDKKRQIALSLYESRTAVSEICATLGISKATLYRNLPTANQTSAC